MSTTILNKPIRHKATIYGFAVHRQLGHYCFNRDYEILPVQLPELALTALKIKAYATCRESSVVMRDFLTAHSLPLDGWVTYWLFNDGNNRGRNYQITELNRLFNTSEVC